MGRKVNQRRFINSPVLLFLFLVVLIFIFVLAGGAYYKNSNPSPSPMFSMIDWEEYKNTKVGFEIKYPKQLEAPYTLQGTEGQGRPVTQSEDDLEIIWGGSWGWFQLEVTPFDGTVEEFQRNGKKSFSLGGMTTRTIIKESTIADRKAIWVLESSKSNPSEKVMEIYLTGKNHGFIFYTNNSIPIEEFNQILSTFLLY